MTVMTIMRLVQLAVIVLVWGTMLHWVTRTPRKGKTGMTQAACPGRKNPACTCTGSCGTTPGPGHCLCTECVSITIRKASGTFSGTTASSAPLASLFGFPAQGSRLGNGGVTGFDGARAKGSDDYEFAIGSVHGLRQWKLPFDSLLHTIMATDQRPCTEALWPAGSQPPLLAGVTGFAWPPGVVEARCKNFPDHEPPVEYDPARKGSCGCVSPETRVLTADLRWVPAGDLVEGEHLLAFDEHPADPGYGRAAGRKYRDAVVASTERGPLPCYDLRFSDGTSVRVSADHRWLCYSGQEAAHWVRTDELRAGDLRASWVVKTFTPWEKDLSREAGYLAGAFDGEGYIHQRPGQPQYNSRIGFTQVGNEMLAEVEGFLKALGFGYQHHISPPSPGQSLRIDGTPRQDKHDLVIGTRPEVLEFLGSVRPVRLLARFQPGLLGRLNMANRVRLVEKTYVGEQEVVKLGTTAGTYFAEGLASHNCGFWGYWKMADQTWHDKLPVFGIMEGTGRVVIGSKGFRAQKARIIALVPAFAIDVATTPDPVPGPYYGSWQQLRSPYEPAVPELSPAGAGDREREIAESRQRADAWLGVIMELLGLMYPEARVFATLKGMLACVPPGEVTQ